MLFFFLEKCFVSVSVIFMVWSIDNTIQYNALGRRWPQRQAPMQLLPATQMHLLLLPNNYNGTQLECSKRCRSYNCDSCMLLRKVTSHSGREKSCFSRLAGDVCDCFTLKYLAPFLMEWSRKKVIFLTTFLTEVKNFFFCC